MNIQDFNWLADENIPTSIIHFLRQEAIDVKSIQEEHLAGMGDEEIFKLAFAEKRIILTQDSDFGSIIFQSFLDFIGVIYLRPGHFLPETHIETLRYLFQQELTFKEKFILIAENKANSIKIRLRQLGD